MRNIGRHLSSLEMNLMKSSLDHLNLSHADYWEFNGGCHVTLAR